MAVFDVSDAKIATYQEGEPAPEGSVMVRVMDGKGGVPFDVYSGLLHVREHAERGWDLVRRNSKWR